MRFCIRMNLSRMTHRSSGYRRPSWLRGVMALVLTFVLLPSVQAQSKITLNLKDADIQTVIATVSEFTGKNFIIDPRVKGKVTIISSKPMDKGEVYQTFLSILEVHNYAAVPAGKLIKILPDVNAKQSSTPVVTAASPGHGDEMVTRVIEIENVSAAQLVPILRPLVPQQGHLAAYAPSNVLILSDRANNVERLIRIIKRVDVASVNDVEVFPLKHASATEVVRILETLRRQNKRDSKSTDSSMLVADERTNSILLSGDKAERLNVRALISHLDTPLESTGNTKVIYLRYAAAKDLVPVLTGLGENVEKMKKGGGKNAAAGSMLNIEAHESTNALVITAAPDVMRSLEGVIRQLDVRRA
ncbi:MAG TPA: type II secretion system protein GspD, partial [Candidatus Tenderia sp.]|nr:type II secretion system protein GspD [Candidatus Tenderia sp.]